MRKKKALITGISGQDAAYLSDFLLKKLSCSWWREKKIKQSFGD